jgi:putative PEP-CTERM system TPR-repeat lipoprotein
MIATARRAVLLIGALALLWVAGCDRGPSLETLLQDAKQAQAKGDHRSAIIHLKNALQKKPDNGEARYLLGASYLETNDPKAAEGELRKALDLQVPRETLLPKLARALILQSEFQKALDETKPDPGREPDLSAELLSARGLAQFSLGQIEPAKASFAEASLKNPDLPEILLGQARLAAAAKDLDGATKLVEQAVAKSPRNLDGLLMRGDLLRLALKPDEAIAAYRKVVEAYPDNIPARLNVASMQMSAAKYDEALKEVDEVKKIAPQSPVANYMRALVEFRKRNYPQARDAVQQVLKLAPGHLPSLLLSGATELALGSYAQAEQSLRKVLERSPKNVYARKLLVLSLLRSHQGQRAIEALEPVLRTDPEDPTVLALAGEVYMQNNEFAKATQYYERAAKIDPKNAQMRTGLGLSRLATGDSERALADLESAADLNTGQYQADVVLVMTYISRNEFDKAEKTLEGLLKKQPDNPLVYNLRAAVLIGKKNNVQARAALEKALQLQPSYFPAVMNLAQLDLQEKNPQAARARFDGILAKDPNNLQALVGLAGLSQRLGASDQEAAGWLEKARTGNPTSYQPRILLARYYLRTGNAKKAVELAQEAQSIAPDNGDVLDTLGTAQLAAGERNGALNTYTKLVAAQPRSPGALLRLANAQIANDSSTSAILTLKKSLEVKPDLVEAQRLLVPLLLKLNRLDEALKIVRDVQKQAPNSPIGSVLEGDVHMAEKKYLAAVASYDKAYFLAKSGQTAIKLHTALVQAGKSDEADSRLAAWLRDNPDDVPVRLYLADADLKVGRHKAAAEQYEAVLKHQPKNVLVLNNLAWAYEQLKDPRAIEVAEQAYKLRADSGPIMDTYGWMLVNQGGLDKGLELLQRAVTLAPDQQEIRYHYAVALVRSGKRDAGRAELERILSGGGNFAQEAQARELLKSVQN